MADDRQNSYAMSLHIFEEEGIENLALLRANNRYGRLGMKIFLESAIRLGHPVRLHMNYVPGANDIDAQLEKLRKSDSEAVLLWGSDEEAAKIINRMRELGMNHKVFGSERMVTDRFLELAGENAEGFVATYPYNPKSEDPLYLEFVENYRERFGEEPGIFAAHSYDGFKILIDSIEKAGLNHARILDALTSYGTYHGVTGDIVFDTTWNDVGKVWLMEVENGQFVVKPSPM
jgi:ABC-type branched-subunit amino acid transport system substrate-binding protein